MIRRKAIWAGASMVGLLALPLQAGANAPTVAQWAQKYGGDLKGINQDINALHNSGSNATNAEVALLCRAITSDTSKMAELPRVPNKSIESQLKAGLARLGKGSIECQAAMATNSAATSKKSIADTNAGVDKIVGSIRALQKLGDNVMTLKAKHAAVPTNTTTTAVVNHVGDTLSTASISVQLQQVIDPAQPTNQYATADAGSRFVGIKVQITNPSSTNIEDDANNDFTIIGSNGQIYTADFDSISGCTNFNNGQYGLTTNASAVGCVTFQIPAGVSVTQVDFVGSASRADWDVP